ncbi:LacI family DNA-binding transcriptional regulator [Tersicoccus sp. Bi-70]|uniref:LacI family DNA-binding transcriptional regulator n=1 Tax=Tersicoccus sp. Bi-70 TaxID=1897634 RepID=UPI000976AB4B|nr:LacI family DNA-binding transcriptional regulator [Tersicoccus sp. Bi-70]OMH36735.1 LacI family transcriptional regulator [Tersicoccus sp. Bi-70]
MAASVRDVAERAGVSVGTVSNVLNSPGKVAPATAERVQAAIDDLGFVRNDAARQLRVGRSHSIGLVVLDVRNPFFTDVARGVEERAAAEGLSVLLANSDERADREAAHLELFEEQRVRGILISPVEEVLPLLQGLRNRGIPSVFVDRLASTPGWSSVSVDDVRGGRDAVEHLLARGRRRILFVGGPLDLPQVRDRLEGARAAVAGVDDARVDVLPVTGLTMAQGVAAGRQILALESRPDAVVAGNDLIALGVLQGVALNGGIRVPEDLAIVGYDDIDFAAAAAVPITSIRQPRERMGALALELLLEQLDGKEPRQIVLQPELVVRASSG